MAFHLLGVKDDPLVTRGIQKAPLGWRVRVFVMPLHRGTSPIGSIVQKPRTNQETRKGDMMKKILVEGNVHRPSSIPVVTVCARLKPGKR